MNNEKPDISSTGSRTTRELVLKTVFFVCALLTVLTTAGIILSLITEAIQFFSMVSPIDFYTGTEWSPTFGDKAFGILPLVMGTLTITIYAALVALPIGLATAIYLSEYAGERTRAYLKPALEVLAGVPTVVYGYFALVYITPVLKSVIPVGVSTFNAMSPAIVMGIMIIPMVSSISEDAMSSVPESLRNAAYGLGATKFQVSTSVVVPASVSGITSAYILAISRAVGETMIVTVAAGANARMVNPFNPVDALQPLMPMTKAMIDLSASEVAGDSAAYKSLFAIGLTLFVITFVMNLISDIIAHRYKEDY
ncbi:MAG: phosphate ABC transporter permease subunit PstC [Halobacteria archaeon]